MQDQLRLFGCSVRRTFPSGVPDATASPPPQTTCALPGTLGATVQLGSCGSFQCGGCAVWQSCDTVLGLCRGSPPLNVSTVPATGGTEAWVVAVAVAVPLAALLGVGGALLLLWLHRRRTAAYDHSTNKALSRSGLAAVKMNDTM